MKKLGLILSLMLFVGGWEVMAQCKDIRIPRGQISTDIKGLTAKNNICYRIRARPGQKIKLHLSSTDARVKFSLSEDYYDADFTAQDVRDWEGELGNVNAYLIAVGGGKAKIPFTLKVTIR